MFTIDIPNGSILWPIIWSVLLIVASSAFPFLRRLRVALKGMVDRQAIARLSKQVDRSSARLSLQVSGLYIYPGE